MTNDNEAAARLIELASRHARVEAQRRLDELMDTLVPEPLYEFPVQGLRLQGGERVRRYYQQFFSDYMARATGGRRVGQWGDETGVTREDIIEIKGPDGPEVHRVMSVFYPVGDRLGGERIYASDQVVRSMAGIMFDELEPAE